MAGEILKHIKSVKGFGIFSDYTHYEGLPDFARYNLVYGWNGTGKTTLTRLLRCFEKQAIYPDFATGTFSIERADVGMAALTHAGLDALNGRVKVFNRDFIDENLDLDIKRDGKAKPVAHVGKENIEKSERLNELKKEIKTATDEKDIVFGKSEGKKKELEKLASAIAGEVKQATQTARLDKYKNYDKRYVKAAYESRQIQNVTLIPDQLTQLKAAISAENKAEINFIPSVHPDLTKILDEIIQIVGTQILTAETIDRLKNNPAIELWVKEGLGVHNHKAGGPCEFCGNELTQERLTAIERHFSGERQGFMDGLDAKIAEITEIKEGLLSSNATIPHQSEFFSEFSFDYKIAAMGINKAVRSTVQYLERFIKWLEEKKNNPYATIKIALNVPGVFEVIKSGFLKNQSDIQTFVEKHNLKVRDFDASVQADKERLEKNFLNAHQADYRGVEDEIAALGVEMEAAEANLKKLQDEKDSIENEIEETRIACETINAHLRDYLGHDEIQFENFKEGYLIKRNGEVARNLSEGEKTAIAFVYFINSLKDNFNLASSVVVVDDPISSLDANNMHHAYHFMVAHTKEAAQVFVLTHNFSFLRKLKQWFSAAKEYSEIESGYFQLVCTRNEHAQRTSRIVKLDKLLKNYDSEYHYLFKLLVDCDNQRVADDIVVYEDLYPLVNAGRKVLETFLDFKYPSNPNKFSQLQNAKVQATGEVFDPAKAELLYGLLNDGSHAGFDTGGFDTFRNSPEVIKRAVETLLDFIGEVDPVHYRNLCKCKGVKTRTKVISEE